MTRFRLRPFGSGLSALALWFLFLLHRAGADEVMLRSGERVTGRVVQENAFEVVVDSGMHGRLTFSRGMVETVVRDEAPGPVVAEPEPSVESVFTTSFSPPKAPQTRDLIPLAPLPSLPSGTNSVARLYWDDHLRYQLSTRLALPDPLVAHSTWLDERLRLRGRIGAKLALDGAVFGSGDGQQAVPDGVQVRTFRILTEGEFGVWLTNQFGVELGLIDGEFYLNKAYWRWVQIPHFGDLTVGYFTVPQTLENIMSFGSLTFMEPSSGTAAFSPGNRAGAAWNQTYLDQRMTAAAGLFSVGQDPSIDFGNASQALAEPVLRVTGLPWAEKNRWLHFGLSYSFVFSGDAEIQYQARPESRLAPFLVNTGSLDARTAMISGFEGIVALGPVLLQAEFVNTRVIEGGDHVGFHGGYLAGGWMITGETRPYNRATGVPTRVQPKHPLWGPNAGWGAFEAAGRYSMVDLTDGPVDGGRMRILMTGVNWYWNQYIRWQFNGGFAHVDGGPSPGNLLIFEARLEAQF